MSATISSEPLDNRFATLRAAGRRALVVYVTAGHPNIDGSTRLVRELPGAGADVIEVGVPFSDPLADGPIIQASSQSALDAGVGFDEALAIIREADSAAPIVLFSYLNPLLAAGEEALQRAAQAGVHGLLLTDLPVGADPALEDWIAAGPLAFIRLVAPTTPPARVDRIATHARGFVYLISRLGVTGVRDELPPDVGATISRLRAATTLPVCVGFGISTPEQSARVARTADGVVVGSAVVRAAARGVDDALELVAAMRASIDAG